MKPITFWWELLKTLHTPLLIPLDLKYTGTEKAMAEAVVAQIAIPNSYIPEVNDCDDFAWRFKADMASKKVNAVGLVIGVLWQGRNPVLHVWNVVSCAGILYQVEPQTGVFFKRDKKYWAIMVIA